MKNIISQGEKRVVKLSFPFILNLWIRILAPVYRATFHMRHTIVSPNSVESTVFFFREQSF